MKNKNVDLIVEEIYSCLPNDRYKFDRIMNNLKNEIVGDYNYSDNIPSTKILSSSEYFQKKNYSNPIPQNYSQNYQMNSNLNNSNSDFIYKNNNKNNIYSQNPNSNFMIDNNNKNIINSNYVSTLPEGEFLNMKPFQPKSNHKIISDVHANSKYYYPEEYNSIPNNLNRQKDMEWNNRTNNIIYNTMRNNWNEDDLKLSNNINQMRTIEYGQNNNNNIMNNNNMFNNNIFNQNNMMNNNNIINNNNLSNLNSNINENLFRNETFGNQNRMTNNMINLNNINNNMSNMNEMSNNNFNNNPMLNANRNYLSQNMNIQKNFNS